MAKTAPGDAVRHIKEPAPDVHVKPVGKAWHLGKVLFERWWLAPWGLCRSLLKSALGVGSWIHGVPVSL
jgi:hypothetical protein